MTEERETLCAINRILPNFSEFIGVILKQEKLSDQAEAWRIRYEASITALEGSVEIKESQAQVQSILTPREASGDVLPPIASSDTKADVDHTQASEVLIDYSGYLLRRDDKLRWHRCWCKVDAKNFSVYTSAERDQVISSHPLERIITQFDSEASKVCDKEHCFLVGSRGCAVEGESESRDSKILEKIYFAAYSEMEFAGWRSAFSATTIRPQVVDISLSNASNGSQLLQVPSQPQPLETDQTLFGKQQLPLPSLPTVNEDTNSDSIVYEELDQLVLQLDETMRATAQTMGQLGQGAKARVKKEKVMAPGVKGRSLSQKGVTEEMGKGISLSSPLYKKNANGSWKKRWCTLKGYVFNYYKSSEDKKGHQYLVLGATVEAVEDPKKQYAFRLACKGVPEMWFAAETKEKLDEWISCLKIAMMTTGTDYDKSLLGLTSKDSVTSDADTSSGIYNIPRSVSDASTYDIPPKKRTIQKDASQILPPPPDRDSTYNVPRSLLLSQSSVSLMPDESPTNPFDLYDVPRSALQYHLADEEGIYDEPPDIGDLEIYDYPPDATADSGESGYCGSVRSSMISLDETSSLSSWGGDQAWKSSTLPPVPTSARPPIQSYRNSSAGSFYDVPRHSMAESSFQLPIEDATNQTDTEGPNQFNQCTMTGYLLKREKFMHWTKMYCVIRNCFLECQKVNNGSAANPVIKLFIPGSQVTPDPDARRAYAFRLKHPRRTGVLQFAAQGESDYKDWLCALQAATSIEVKPADTVDEIRITDLEQNKRWTSLEKGMTRSPEEGELSGRRKTVSGEGGGDEGMDTLRRKKFQWMKRNRKQLSSNDLQPGKQPDATLTERSVSLMSLDSLSSGGAQPSVRAYKSVNSMGQESFQGYLKVQRKGADSLWVRYWCVLKDKVISCFIAQNDLTLTLSVPLAGSTVLEAKGHRKLSFEISHLESGQCLYFAADCKEDYDGWFGEITIGAQQVQLQDSTSPAMYLHPKSSGTGSQQSSESSSTVSDGIFSPSSGVAPPLASSIQHKGELLRLSNTGEWKKYHCILRDGGLHVHYTVFDKTPIFVIALQGCVLDSSIGGKHVFTVTTSFGKCHTFDALSEQDMHKWMQALQAYCQVGPPPPAPQQATISDKRSSSPVTMRPKHAASKSSKLKDADLVSYIPASKLSNANYSGVAEIQFGTGPWQKYWAVLHLQCLYIYQTRSSQSTVKTIVLPGYKVSVAGPLVKKPFVITLTHSCVLPTNLAASDQTEMDTWFSALDQASRLDAQEIERQVSFSKEPIERTPSTEAMEKEEGVSDEKPTQEPQICITENSASSLIEKKQSIIHRFEKRIRRTHKVASQTEQSLKQQQTQLQTFKDELNRWVAKLEEKARSGDNQALLKIKDAEVRIQQVSKILPYLTKYIQFNKKAELQTVAILSESCRVELSKLEDASMKPSSNAATLQASTSANTNSTRDQLQTTEQSVGGMQSVPAGDSRQIKVLSTVGNYARVEFLQSKSPQPQLKSVDYAKIDKTLLGSNSKWNDPAKTDVSSQQKKEPQPIS